MPVVPGRHNRRGGDSKPGTRSLGGALAFVLAVCLIITPAATLGGDHQIFRSKRVTVHYQEQEHLKEFGNKIKPGTGQSLLDAIFIGGDESPQDLARFLDRLFVRVQSILNMPMPRKKVIIKIHPSQGDLTAFFKSAYGGPNAAQRRMGARSHGPAFYVKKTNTIHLQTETMTKGILAHEMGHAITANYFVVPIPVNVAELMSQFVEKQVSRGR